MTYDLHLEFRRTVEHLRFFSYFIDRRHYSVGGARDVVYENPDTGVGFFLTYRIGRSLLLRSKVTTADIEINYCRPSYWGLEAEIEVEALVNQFSPRIEDTQIDGMDTGPYSRKGFLDGWNFGNKCAVHTALQRGMTIASRSLPADQLQALWRWNYGMDYRVWMVRDRQFVPRIRLFEIDGRPRRVALWPKLLPILLPRVDYVLLGRESDGHHVFGLASWAELLEAVGSAGFDAKCRDIGVDDYIELPYAEPPVALARWFHGVPLVDLKSIPRFDLHEVLDTEIIDAARRLRTSPVM